MNFAIMNAAFASALPSHLKLTLLAFSSFANADGENIYPSLARIAAMTGKTPRAVQKDTRALVARGNLVPVGFRSRGVVVYRLAFGTSEPSASGRNSSSQGGTPVPMSDTPSQAPQVGTPVRGYANCSSPTYEPQFVSPTNPSSYDLELSTSRTTNLLSRSHAPGPAAPGSVAKADDYDALTKDAVDLALQQRQDSLSDCLTQFAALCDQRGLSYDPDRAAITLTAALDARNQKRTDFLRQLRGSHAEVPSAV